MMRRLPRGRRGVGLRRGLRDERTVLAVVEECDWGAWRLWIFGAERSGEEGIV